MPQTATNGTSEADIVVGYDSVVIPPGYVYTLHQWSASQSGAYQFEPVSFSYAEV
jgi:spore germination protein YaaH